MLCGVLLSPALDTKDCGALLRAVLLSTATSSGMGLRWAQVVVGQLLWTGEGEGAAWLDDPEVALSLHKVWQSLTAQGAMASHRLGARLALLVLHGLEGGGERALGLACPQAVAWCWSAIVGESGGGTAEGEAGEAAGRLLPALCRASDVCCLQAAQLLHRLMDTDTGKGVMRLGPTLAVVARRAALEAQAQGFLDRVGDLTVALAFSDEQDAGQTGEGVEEGWVQALETCVAAAGEEALGRWTAQAQAWVAACQGPEAAFSRPLSGICAAVLLGRGQGAGEALTSFAALACNGAATWLVQDDSEEEEGETGLAHRCLTCLRRLLPRLKAEGSEANANGADGKKRKRKREATSGLSAWSAAVVELAVVAASSPLRAGPSALTLLSPLLTCALAGQEGEVEQSALQVVEALLQSSELDASLASTSQVRLPLLRLLLLLTPRLPSPSPLSLTPLLPALLSGYDGGLSLGDLLTLRLLRLLTQHAHTPLHVGPWLHPGQPLAKLRNALHAPSSSSSNQWVLEWLQLPRVYATLVAFPLDRPLFPPPTPDEATDHTDSSDHPPLETPMASQKEEAAVYDPSFVLPLLDAVLREEGGEGVSVRGLLSSGMLALALVAMASSERGIRLCAASCLQRMATLLENAPRNDAGTCIRPHSLSWRQPSSPSFL